ncbi:intein N-terminal splicing region [Chryseolinea serpens]|uniref:Intein N-terminal splicing region n=1 Tax=Chryseolinea serpens TaxID=947013 RepID=A0A1M5VKV3_9BACT|nr:Hint domain-containing protein [Chryseolinea serpens]SHH75855.1 intein N-terminal splicing region [Chryseolinea serpens]
MTRKFAVVLACMFVLSTGLKAQDVVKPRPLTMAEYEKAKTFVIKDLDNETYVKFENTYILDRYELRKPYFITGDDGLKKRMDLYKLLAKEGMQELGLVIFYTNEKGTQYKACLPNFTADAKVWEKYFEDIHAIDKLEQNFVLKLSYVLSKEVGYQLYKAQNQGKDLSKESATYGNDICFPGDQQVTLANGTRKTLASLKRGDEVLTVNPLTKTTAIIKVNTLVEHEAKNYAITQLVLQRADKHITPNGSEIILSTRTLEATPNHPVQTHTGTTKMGDVKENDTVLCLNKASGDYEPFTVISKKEYAGGVQKVYNIVAGDGTPFLMNDVMVLQK